MVRKALKVFVTRQEDHNTPCRFLVLPDTNAFQNPHPSENPGISCSTSNNLQIITPDTFVVWIPNHSQHSIKKDGFSDMSI